MTTTEALFERLEDAASKCMTDANNAGKVAHMPGIYMESIKSAAELGQAIVALKQHVEALTARPAEDVAPQRLLDLADRIDHEKLWARAGLERDGWTQEQHDRCDAGVHLRRYADLLGSNSWRIYPPKGIPTRFSATTLGAAIAMAKREEARRNA